MSEQKIYSSVIEDIFKSKYRKGMKTVDFERTDIPKSCKKLGIDHEENLPQARVCVKRK